MRSIVRKGNGEGYKDYLKETMCRVSRGPRLAGPAGLVAVAVYR
jgi:hypothetical protein